MLTRIFSLAALAAFLIFPSGCGDEDGGASKEEITGLWQATQVEYVNLSGSDVVELISLGCVATLDLGADASFHYVCTPPEGAATILDGTWELTGDIGDMMRVNPAGAPWYFMFEVELSGSTLKLMKGGGEYDFDGDQVMEDAHWNMKLVRANP